MSDDQTNEIVAAAKDAKASEARAKKDRSRKDGTNWPLIGLGVGIGSAAVAAAMLYAKRDKDD